MKINAKIQRDGTGFAQRLKAALGKRGALSQLSRQTGISVARLSDLANGRARSLPIETALAIERAVGVDLLGGDRAALSDRLRELIADIERSI